MPKRSVLFSFVALLAVIAAYVYLTQIADYPSAQAVLVVRSGEATVVRAAGTQQVRTGEQVALNPQDSIQMKGQGTLAFVGAQIDLTPGTQLQIVHYGASGGEAQTELKQ